MTIAGAALFGAGAFVGAWGGAALGAEPRGARIAVEPRAGASNPSGDSGELAAAAAELRAGLASLERALVELRTGAPPEREVLRGAEPATGAEDPPELAAALRELAAAIDALRVRSSGSSVAAHAPDRLDPVERRSAFELDALQSAGQRSREELDELVADFRRRHLAWTSQEVLERFGQPDGIFGFDGGANWDYALPLFDGGGFLQLTFRGDRLVHVQAHASR